MHLTPTSKDPFSLKRDILKQHRWSINGVCGIIWTQSCCVKADGVNMFEAFIRELDWKKASAGFSDFDADSDFLKSNKVT